MQGEAESDGGGSGSGSGGDDLESPFARQEPHVAPRALVEWRPEDFFAATRERLLAFASAELPGNDASPASLLPREMVYEIGQLLCPFRARTFVVGPHSKGDLWLECDCTVAVCRLGPAIVMTSETVSSGMLVARLAFWGSAIWCVGVLPADHVHDAGALWYEGCCGVFNHGAGCSLLQAEMPVADMPCDVILDADARMFALSFATLCYRLPIPAALLPPFCIAATLWAGGKACVLNKGKPFTVPSDEQT